MALLMPEEDGLLDVDFFLLLEERTDLPSPPWRRLSPLLERLALRRSLGSLTSPSPPLPPSWSASSRRLLREEEGTLLVVLLRPLLEPCATAKARKVDTKTIPEKVKNALALNLSALTAPELVADEDADGRSAPEAWPSKYVPNCFPAYPIHDMEF